MGIVNNVLYFPKLQMQKVENYFCTFYVMLGFYLVPTHLLHVEEESQLKLLSKLHLHHTKGEDWLFLMSERHPAVSASLPAWCGLSCS